MVLKEAYRYANHLDSLIGSALSFLRDSNNTTIVTEKHLRSKAKPDIPDVVKDNLDNRDLPVSPDSVVDFMVSVVQEKELLYSAIDRAKANYQSIDNSLALCKTKQGCVDTMKRMLALKRREQTRRGSDYCFNAEGNQSSFYYDIQVSSRIDFNRSKIKQLVEKMTSEIDEVSTHSDYLKTSVTVDFSPAFSLNDTFEELVGGIEDADMDSAS